MSDVRWEDRDERRWIHLQGELDYDGCRDLEGPFREVATSGSGAVVVDLADVSFVASQCLRMLLETNRLLKDGGRRMLLTNPQPHVRKVFETTGLFMAIPEYEK